VLPRARGQRVEGLQLLEVARETVGVAQADADESAELERFAGQVEVLGRGGVGRVWRARAVGGLERGGRV
jgi:hypothetical protein